MPGAYPPQPNAPMITRYDALASEAVAQEAAQEFLGLGGSAPGAVLAGFFAAAGAHAGVLLGPLSVLVGAVGSRVRAFDGRLRQPGLGGRRPRGFRAGEGVPDAARVAVPTAVAAALVAHAYDGGLKLGGILKAGVRLARRGGAESRAALLLRVRAVGATALTETDFVRILLREAGPSQGGLLTPADFGAAADIDQAGVLRTVDDTRLQEPPWSSDPGQSAPGSDIGLGGAVCAVDARGVFAAACYRRVREGFLIEDLELEAPLAAVPVHRGVARAAPGSRLPAPAPVAIRVDDAGTPLEVLAAPRAERIDESTLGACSLRLRRDPRSGEVVRAKR